MVLRVLITDQLYEFTNIEKNQSAYTFLGKEANLYFPAYVVTSHRRLYFQPSKSQIEQFITKKEVIVSIFILKNYFGQDNLLLLPL